MLRPALVLFALLAALAVQADGRAEEAGPSQPGPVVVELFTSQGCSSCPEADRMLAKLAQHEDVLALALHVDYWDYIGWEDRFADPAHAKRQKAYAYVSGQRMIYTPQMVVQGRESVPGTRPAELLEAIAAHAGRAGAVELRATRHGATLRVEARSDRPFEPPLAVQLVRYDPHRTTAITHGENAGHTFDYVNVVTEWLQVGRWDGREPLSMSLDAPGEARAAVLLQEPGPGLIRAAARAD